MKTKLTLYRIFQRWQVPLLITIFVLQASTALQAHAQDEPAVSLHLKNAPITKIFAAIEEQTDYTFTYSQKQLSELRIPRIRFKAEKLQNVLRYLESQVPLEFMILNKSIGVKVKPAPAKRSNSTGDREANQTPVFNIPITGKVTDGATGEPLAGATVQVKGTSIGTTTDAAGNFSLSMPNDAKMLLISYLGYRTAEVAVSNQTQLDIQMEKDATAIGEVVVVGYGTQSKAAVTGSVVQLKNRDIKDFPITSFEQGLAGQLPGVQVLQTTGTPGGGMSIRVRGIGSISANNDPLIVIDGFPVSNSYNTSGVQGSRPSNATRRETPQNPLSTINPNDIESVEVLKDAAAAAIYGSRGSNGVILITTKRGSKGKPQIDFNTYHGIQQVTQTYEMADAYEAAELSALAVNTTWVESGPNRSANDPNSARPSNLQIPPIFLPYLRKEPGLTNTDWQDAIFQEAPIQNYELSVRGGNDNVQYFVSGNYFDQEGIVIESGFKRYALRFNLESKLSDRVRLSVNFNPSFSDNDLVSAENPYFVDGIVNNAFMTFPVFPVYNEDGTLAVNKQNTLGLSTVPAENPVALAKLIEDRLEQFRTIGGAALEVDLLQGLKFKTYLGADINTFRRGYYRPSTIGNNGVPAPTIPTARSFTSRTLNWISENTLTYATTIANNHNLNLLAGYSVQRENINRNSLFATNFPNDLVTTLNGGQVTSGASNIEEWMLISYIGRLTYDYKNKYLLSASIRRDGSSRFGNNNKWGYFPSVSAGWRISEESFLQNSSWLSETKLRASYGQTGNFEIPNYGSISLLDPSNYPIGGNTNANGLATSNAPNPDLSWEKREMINVGLDLGLFNNKLNVTADYYVANTKDLLLNVPVPGLTGFSTALQNIGAVRNTGIELGLSTNLKLGNAINWNASANFSTNQNEVTALGQNGDPIIANGGVNGTHITRIGSPIGSYYGYKVLGTFNNQAELDAYPHFSSSRIGDFKFEDVNKDGKLDANDRTVLGDFFPDYTFGISNTFTFKGLDLSFFIQGVQGNEILHLSQRYLTAFGFGNVTQDAYDNAWRSAENPGNGRIHRVVRTVTGSSNQVSTYMIEDGSYVRVRNITLGYSLPKNLVNKAKLENARIYFTTQNPFTFTKYPGYNPEVNQRPEDALTQGEDYGTYPLAKSFVLGLNLTF
jgi:TonB-linked SusC/RagA family outer membrane protein